MNDKKSPFLGLDRPDPLNYSIGIETRLATIEQNSGDSEW